MTLTSMYQIVVPSNSHKMAQLLFRVVGVRCPVVTDDHLLVAVCGVLPQCFTGGVITMQSDNNLGVIDHLLKINVVYDPTT